MKKILVLLFVLLASSVHAQTHVFSNRLLVQDEGVNLLPQFWTLNFLGDGVICSTNSTTQKIECVITGGGVGSGASTANTYVTNTPAADLTNEQALSLLATGLLKNTTGTGLLSIAVAGTDYSAPGHTHVKADVTDFAHLHVKADISDFAHSHGDAEVANNITLDNITQITNRAISDTTGTLGVTRGGTGLTTVADDQVYVGTAADTFTAKSLPSCSGVQDKLLYNTATNTFSCGVDDDTDTAIYIVSAGDATGINPAANSTYYAAFSGVDPGTSESLAGVALGFYVPTDGVINKVKIQQYILGTNGVNGENITYRLRKAATTDSSVIATLDTDADGAEGTVTTLNFAVSTGDNIVLKYTTPVTWTVAPTIMFIIATITLEH